MKSDVQVIFPAGFSPPDLLPPVLAVLEVTLTKESIELRFQGDTSLLIPVLDGAQVPLFSDLVGGQVSRIEKRDATIQVDYLNAQNDARVLSLQLPEGAASPKFEPPLAILP